jgi:hypothetical protein
MGPQPFVPEAHSKGFFSLHWFVHIPWARGESGELLISSECVIVVILGVNKSTNANEERRLVVATTIKRENLEQPPSSLAHNERY